MNKSELRIKHPKRLLEGDLKIPIFNKGMLVYENSGHGLTVVGKYYACAEKQKGKCINGNEKMFDQANFERKFGKYIKDLKMDFDNGIKLYFEIEKSGLDIQANAQIEINKKRQNMDATLKAMEKDFNQGITIKKSDITFLK